MVPRIITRLQGEVVVNTMVVFFSVCVTERFKKTILFAINMHW